jgi:hypothetical protein
MMGAKLANELSPAYSAENSVVVPIGPKRMLDQVT